MNLGSFQSFQGGLSWCSSIRAGGGPSRRSEGPQAQVSLALVLQTRGCHPSTELPPPPPLPSFLHVLHSDPFRPQESRRWGSYPTSERLFQNLLRIFPEEAEEEGQELEKRVPSAPGGSWTSRPGSGSWYPASQEARISQGSKAFGRNFARSVPGLVGAGEDRSLSLDSVLPQDLPETPRNLREKD